MNKNCTVFVTGHRGLVGSAVCRELAAQGFTKILTATRQEVDLSDPVWTETFFHTRRPEYVIHCAAKVGGIGFHSNNPVSAMAENLSINENVIHSSACTNVKKLLFLGSACAYPKLAPVPIKESSLLTGALEPSNEGYALAKIVGIRLCQYYKREQGKNFISCMPTNVYGVGDSYDLENCHALPGMLRRIHEAKLAGKDARLWGSGKPTREFIWSDDLARACLVLMEKYDGEETVNIGTGDEIALSFLAKQIARTVRFEGRVQWDASKPDGTPRRFLDSSKIFKLGWRPNATLESGLERAYEDFLSRFQNL